MTDKDVLMVCIADLGLAIKNYDIKCRTEQCGTPGYVDPEVLNGQAFTTKSDIFSLGSLLYNIVTCRFLFGGTSARAILHKNKHQDPNPIIEKYCKTISADCRDLMKRMLAFQQSKRPSAEECLRHPWFSSVSPIIESMLALNK